MTKLYSLILALKEETARLKNEVRSLKNEMKGVKDSVGEHR